MGPSWILFTECRVFLLHPDQLTQNINFCINCTFKSFVLPFPKDIKIALISNHFFSTLDKLTENSK